MGVENLTVVYPMRKVCEKDNETVSSRGLKSGSEIWVIRRLTDEERAKMTQIRFRIPGARPENIQSGWWDVALNGITLRDVQLNETIGGLQKRISDIFGFEVCGMEVTRAFEECGFRNLARYTLVKQLNDETKTVTEEGLDDSTLTILVQRPDHGEYNENKPGNYFENMQTGKRFFRFRESLEEARHSTSILEKRTKKPDRRRLTSQRLINRVIRESTRCQSS